jgi:hypothetical protein
MSLQVHYIPLSQPFHLVICRVGQSLLPPDLRRKMGGGRRCIQRGVYNYFDIHRRIWMNLTN